MLSDTGIPTTNLNAVYSGSPQNWANALATRITVNHPLHFVWFC